MNIEQLTYIVEVARQGSLAKATETLHITQSGLSQAITKLEAELELKLFERTSKGINVTPEGREIIRKAEKTIASIDDIFQEAKEQKLQSQHVIRIANIVELTNPLLNVYQQTKHKNNLRIKIIEQESMKTIEDVEKGVVDIGFIVVNNRRIIQLNNLIFQPIFEGHFMFVTLNKDIKKRNVSDLSNEFFVLYNDSSIIDIFEDYQKHFKPVTNYIKTKEISIINKAMKELNAITVGHDVFPLYTKQEFGTDDIQIHLRDYLDTSITFGWIMKKDNFFTPGVYGFMEEVNKILPYGQQLFDF